MEKGISVIIPTYNRESFIKETIQSVINQNYGYKVEIIISDDGSTDGTLSIVEGFGDKIKIVRKPENCVTQGPSGTRNRGIRMSSQPYISFLDSDDFYLPGHLSKIASALERRPTSGFAFCRTLEVKEVNNSTFFRPWTHLKILKADIINPVVSRNNIVHSNSFLFKREIFDTIGGFDESYTNGEDGDCWMRISELYEGVFANHYGTAYRTDHGATHQIHNNPEEILIKNYRIIFENALLRYYALGLKNKYRVFRLKKIILAFKYNNKFTYRIKYFILICRYPFTFISRSIKVAYYQALEKNELKNWHDLQKFL